MQRTKIIIKATTITPLYTGEIREEDILIAKKQKITYPIRKTNTGKVLVQFKGPLRATGEILLKERGINVCNITLQGGRTCKVCPICVLFGAFGKKGKLNIGFLVSDDDKSFITRLNTHIKINRENGMIIESYRSEEVIEGVTFTSKIIATDITDEELSILKDILIELEDKGIGGWTHKGYGRMKYELSII